MTTEELKAIQRRARMQPGTVTVGQDTERLCTEVRRLQEAVAKALMVSQRFGSIDGDHHKAWVIDQMVRELTGSAYVEFVTQAKVGGYDWDEGIAP